MFLENLEGVHERNKKELIRKFSDKGWTEKEITNLYDTIRKDMEGEYKKNKNFIPTFAFKDVKEKLNNYKK